MTSFFSGSFVVLVINNHSLQDLLRHRRSNHVGLNYMSRYHSTIWCHLLSKTRIDLDKFHSIEFRCCHCHFHHRRCRWYYCYLMPCTPSHDQSLENCHCKQLAQALSNYRRVLHHTYNSFPKNKLVSTKETLSLTEHCSEFCWQSKRFLLGLIKAL